MRCSRTPEARAGAQRTDAAAWHHSPPALGFIFGRYLPLLAAASLAWEAAHLPFYTIWQEAGRGKLLFAVAHCTGGDILIGAAALLIGVTLFGRCGWPRSGHGRVLGAATLLGLGYTILSEWVNAELIMSWEYAESMVRVPPFGTGLTPLLQWMVVSPVAYGAAYLMGKRRATAAAST